MKKFIIILFALLLAGCTNIDNLDLGADIAVDKTVDNSSLTKLEDNIIYTDDNTGESFIIRVNKNSYTGLSGIDVEFSVENTGDADSAEIKFNLTDATLASLKEYSQKETIVENTIYEDGKEIVCVDPLGEVSKDQICYEQVEVGTEKTKYIKDVWTDVDGKVAFDADETKFFKARINFKRGTAGDFNIEVIGKNNYGKLE